MTCCFQRVVHEHSKQNYALLQLQDGDHVRIDTKTRKVEAPHISEEEWSKRRAAWKAPPLKATKGALYKYIKNVASASMGCVTDL